MQMGKYLKFLRVQNTDGGRFEILKGTEYRWGSCEVSKGPQYRWGKM